MIFRNTLPFIVTIRKQFFIFPCFSMILVRNCRPVFIFPPFSVFYSSFFAFPGFSTQSPVRNRKPIGFLYAAPLVPDFPKRPDLPDGEGNQLKKEENAFSKIRPLPYCPKEKARSFFKAPGFLLCISRYQYSLAPAGMWSSTIRQWSFSTPASWCTAEMIMPQESIPIILRGGRLVMAIRVLPTSSSGS